MFTMIHYIIETQDGNIHVQNAVMGNLGQHHVHSKNGFELWKKETGIKDENIEILKDNKCDCGLKIGEVKDHHGNITKNLKFE